MWYNKRGQITPSPTGTQLIANNHIIRKSTAVTQNGIKIGWDSTGYGSKEFTEIYNNEIIHLDGNDQNSIDVSGAGLGAAPRTKVVGNKITTFATLAGESQSPNLIGGIIYAPYQQLGKSIIHENYRNGIRIGETSRFRKLQERE